MREFAKMLFTAIHDNLRSQVKVKVVKVPLKKQPCEMTSISHGLPLRFHYYPLGLKDSKNDYYFTKIFFTVPSGIRTMFT